MKISDIKKAHFIGTPKDNRVAYGASWCNLVVCWT